MEPLKPETRIVTREHGIKLASGGESIIFSLYVLSKHFSASWRLARIRLTNIVLSTNAVHHSHVGFGPLHLEFATVFEELGIPTSYVTTFSHL